MKKKSKLFDELDNKLSILTGERGLTKKLLKRHLELKAIFAKRFKDIYINEFKNDFEDIKNVCEKHLTNLEKKYKNYFKIQIIESHYNPTEKFNVQTYEIKLSCEKKFYSNYIKENKSLKNLIENVTGDVECDLTIRFFGPLYAMKKQNEFNQTEFNKGNIEEWENKLHNKDLDISLTVSSNGYVPLFTDFWDGSYEKEEKKLAYEKFVRVFHKLVFGI
jgi:hypothetical protein